MNSVFKSALFQCTDDGNVSTTCGGYPRRFDDGQWFMLQRIRKAWENDGDWPFAGPLEVDETYMGGRERNKHKGKKLKAGCGTVGKTAVIGVKDRKTNKVRAKVTKKIDAKTLQKFVSDNAAGGATVYTDDAAAYKGMPFEHEAVKHSVGEYVDGMAHTNGIELFWSMLKRAHKGVYHKISPKHLQTVRGRILRPPRRQIEPNLRGLVAFYHRLQNVAPSIGTVNVAGT